MDTVWVPIGHVADVVTILAAALAFAGLLSAFLTRPRVTLHVHSSHGGSASIYLSNDRGARPAHHVTLEWACLLESGVATSGSGEEPTWELLPGRGLAIQVFDAESTHLPDPGPNEVRIPIPRSYGAAVRLAWQSAVIPWRRETVVIYWSRQDRDAARDPQQLKGRRGVRVFNRAMPPPARS